MSQERSYTRQRKSDESEKLLEEAEFYFCLCQSLDSKQGQTGGASAKLHSWQTTSVRRCMTSCSLILGGMLSRFFVPRSGTSGL